MKRITFLAIMVTVVTFGVAAQTTMADYWFQMSATNQIWVAAGLKQGFQAAEATLEQIGDSPHAAAELTKVFMVIRQLDSTKVDDEITIYYSVQSHQNSSLSDAFVWAIGQLLSRQQQNTSP